MSYRAIFFAFPFDEVSRDDLVAALPKMAVRKETWRTIERFPPVYGRPEAVPTGSQTHLYAMVSTEAEAKRSGLYYVHLASNDRLWDYWMKFEHQGFLAHAPTDTCLLLGHDDREGVFFFERRAKTAPKLFWLLSAGALLGGSVAKIAVPYAQSGWANDELRALAAKDEDALTPEEHRAVTEHDDAITIGLRQFHPKARFAEYLPLLHAKEVLRFSSTDPPALVPRPSGLCALLARVPSTAQIKRAGLAGEAREHKV